MANITEYLQKIKNAIYGKEVRNSIHDSIEAINNDCTNRLNIQDDRIQEKMENQDAAIQANSIKQNLLEQLYDEQIRNIAASEPQSAEIVDARAGFDTLGLNLKQRVYHFENIEDMKVCRHLRAGDVVRTLGYYLLNDGGGAEYKIKSSSSSYYETLNNNLVAELISSDTMYPEQFGAYGDLIHDDTTAIENAINYVGANHLTLFFLKSYLVNSLITISSKDAFKILSNQQVGGHVTNNYIYAPNGFLKIEKCTKLKLENLSVNSGTSTAIEFFNTENRWITIDNCIFYTSGIGIDAKSLYYSTISKCRFNNCRRAMSFGNNGSGAGDITIFKCHIPNLTTAFYVNTDSQIRILESCIENVATVLYQNGNSSEVTFIDCYIGDGFRQGFIVNNGNLYLTNIPGQLVSTPSNQRSSEFTDDRYVIDLKNNSNAFINSVTFNEYYSSAPIIKMSTSANIFIENVKFLGYRLLETAQTYILGKRQKNYITGTTLSGDDIGPSGTEKQFSVTAQSLGTNYMGNAIIKYTNTHNTALGVSYSYKVPKAGYYLLWLKMTSNYDYDYITFKSGCYVPSSSEMPNNKYRKTTNPNFSINTGYENIIRPSLVAYPDSIMVVPIYIDDSHLEDSFLLSSQQSYANDEKTIDFIGLTDFENPFALPLF